MATKQDLSKKILKKLSDDDILKIEKELENIPSYAASESAILTDEQRAVMTKQIAEKYKEIFNLAKLDYLNDENLKDTPFRIASMYINELMVGRYSPAPRIEAFPANYYNIIQQDMAYDNSDMLYAEKAAKDIHIKLDEITEKFYKYAETDPVVSNLLLKEADKLLTELMEHEERFLPKVNTRNMVVKSVDVNSLCSHHFIPFVSTDEKDSRAVIAYIPRLGSDKALLGISKLQRIMDFFGRRPQLQETLNWQIKTFISLILRSQNVMVSFHNIVHYCEKTRGVESHCGSTSSIEYTGLFTETKYRDLAFSLIK